MATASQRLQFLLSVDAKGAVKGFQDTATAADRELGKVDGNLDKLGTKFTAFGAGALAAAGVAMGGLSSLATSASDLEESINAVEVTYGEAAAAILEQSKNAATSVGLPRVEFNNLAVAFKGFADTIAGQDGTTVDQTINELMTRVADFASVMNLDVPEAATLFQSALAGQTEPLRKYGVDVSAATVKQFALEQGIIDTDRELTEAEKTYARYKLILEETDTAAGDFKNTQDSLANQQRILAADFENLKADIGAGLLPIFQTLVTTARNAVGVFGDLDEATKGAAGQVLGFGTVALGAVGGMSLLIGQVIKARRAIQAFSLVVSRNPWMMAAIAAAAIGTSMIATKDETDSAADALMSFGGLTEDLQPVVTMFQQLGDVSLDNLSSLGDVDFMSAMEGISDFGDKLNPITGITRAVGDGLESLLFGSEDAAEGLNMVSAASDGAARGIGPTIRAQQDAAESSDDLAESLEEQTKALEDAAKAAEENEQAVNDMADAQRASADAVFNHRKRQQDFRDQLAETTAAMENQELSAEEQQIALDDLALSAADVADAAADIAEEQANAAGKTLTASERMGVWNQSMVSAAAQADGPLRQSIIDYIAEVNNIPASKASEIQALIDQGKLAEAEQALNDASKVREAQIEAETETAAVNAELNTLARQRDSLVVPDVSDGSQRYVEGQLNNTARSRTSTAIPDISAGSRDFVEGQLNNLGRPRTVRFTPSFQGGAPGQLGVRHVGGRVSEGQPIQPLSGEVFVPDQPGRIMSREDTERMLTDRPRSGTVVNVTVNNPRSEDDVRRAVSRALALAELQS